MKRYAVIIAALSLALALPAGIQAVRAEAAVEPAPYTLDLASENIETHFLPYYVPNSTNGYAVTFDDYWEQTSAGVKRSKGLSDPSKTSDVEENLAALYFKDLSFRWFEMEYAVTLGSINRLCGVIFGSSNMTVRHLASGNAVYFMNDPCVEVKGSTVAVTAHESLSAAADKTYRTRIVCTEGNFTVSVNGREVLTREYPAELFKEGRIALFATGTDALFSGEVKIWNLNAEGERIPLADTVLATGVDIEEEKITLQLGGSSVRLHANVLPEDATNKNVSYLASDPNIVGIDGEGNIYPLAEGNTQIYAITDDGAFRDGCAVEVVEEEIALESVSLDRTEYTGTVGEQFYLIPTASPEDADNVEFSWSSSDASVAFVNNGTVMLRKEGEAVITVRDRETGLSATCNITVKAAQQGGTAQEEQNSQNADENSGCGSSVAGGSALLCALVLAAGTAALIGKRRKDR